MECCWQLTMIQRREQQNGRLLLERRCVSTKPSTHHRQAMRGEAQAGDIRPTLCPCTAVRPVNDNECEQTTNNVIEMQLLQNISYIISYTHPADVHQLFVKSLNFFLRSLPVQIENIQLTQIQLTTWNHIRFFIHCSYFKAN